MRFMLTLDLVIIHRNESKYLSKLFNSIRTQNLRPRKIFFVDNFSDEDPINEINRYKDLNIEYIRTTKNLFFTAGTNIGLRKAIKNNPDVIGILNADTYFEKDCFKILINFLENHPNTIGVSPKVLNYLGKSVIFYPIKYSKYRKLFTSGDETKISKTDALGGAHSFIKTNALKKTGIFYEPFYHGTEDMYLNFKLRRLGKLYYLPTAIGYHRDWNEDRPMRNTKSEKYLQLSSRNSYVYSIKTKDPILFITSVLSFPKNIILCVLDSKNTNIYINKMKGFLWGVSETGYHLFNNDKYITTHIDYNTIPI